MVLKLMHNMYLWKIINRKPRTFQYYQHSKFSQDSEKLCLFTEKLSTRNIITVSGYDISDYLQGLVTNDLKHLEESSSLYSMFLNIKGRVLCDTLMYKANESNTLHLECDTAMKENLIKHLKLYRVRRKINVVDNSEHFDVWVLGSNYENNNEPICDETNEEIARELKDTSRSLLLAKDPRTNALGTRIVAPKNVDLTKILNEKGISVEEKTFYKKLRYKLGIGEGVVDIQPGIAFPLEANCDYLHGISFHKGCYIGQELTARTHHTGVIRKRLMPLFFDQDSISVNSDTPVYSTEQSETSLGKVKGTIEGHGLGLLRIQQVLSAPGLLVNGVAAKTIRPFWWPTELPKEPQNG